MKTILVPTDFSPNADNALHYALNLADHLHGKVILLHNVENPVDYTGAGVGGFATSDPLLSATPVYPPAFNQGDALQHISEDRLNELVLKLRQTTSVALESTTVAGSLTDNLNNLVREQRVDLVVMGTKGATNFLERIIGSNTASYMQVAVCPVLAVPAKATFSKWERIAYAFELERTGGTFLNQLFSLTDSFSPAINLITVESKFELDIVPDHQIMEDIKNKFPNRNITFTKRESDYPAQVLEEFALSQQMDILAVAIINRGFLESFIHSSVSEKLVFQSVVPVLSLPEHPYKA